MINRVGSGSPSGWGCLWSFCSHEVGGGGGGGGLTVKGFVGLLCFGKFGKYIYIYIYTERFQNNLFAFAYRPFHEDFSSIYGTLHGTHSFSGFTRKYYIKPEKRMSTMQRPVD